MINKLVVIMTCFNRKEYTLRCVKSLALARHMAGDEAWEFHYIIVDDNSTDGTEVALMQLAQEQELFIKVIKGDGSLFYSGGMRRGIECAQSDYADADCYMLINDDVCFDSGAVASMVQSMHGQNAVLVGATKDSHGSYSYGGVKYTKGIRYTAVKPEDNERSCDTFNANCVLIPGSIFRKTPNMDSVYIHALGDFDYGLSISRAGYTILVYDKYIGMCDKNCVNGTWNDITLSRRERLSRKESPKGLPRRDWFHFLRKNFGFATAVVRSATPYVRILLKR